MLMCDTFVHVPQREGRPVLFGKNSDREPNEAQHIVRFPRQIRENDAVKTTYIDVSHPRDVFEVILSKPFQMWGAEMGINEHGVVIGNEAVFTKMPLEKKNNGLTGMDLIRLALEISKSAQEALEHIITYQERYGQDACGGYSDKNFYYHNSFILADKEEAYVLETAGKFWVYEKVNGYRAISNGLSIESEYDGITPGAIDFARKQGWSKNGEAFNFKKAFSAFLMPKLARCETRRAQNEFHGKAMGSLSAGDAIQILRSHKDREFNSDKARPDSLCMHASGLFSPHQTTGSMVVELFDYPTVWLTGSSSPCLSIYKPFYIGDNLLSEKNFLPPSAMSDRSYWWQWEKFNREVIKNYRERKAVFMAERDEVEKQWLEREKEIRATGASPQDFRGFSKKCLEASEALREKWMNAVLKVPEQKRFFYDRFWKDQNKKAHV